ALYRASRDIGEADGAHGIIAAIGEHLAGPEDEGVAFWRLEDRMKGSGGPVGFVRAESWTPPGSRGWPPGISLDTERVPDGLRRGSPVVLRTRELPDLEREAWESEGLRSALLVPLVASRGAEIGLLMVASRRGRYFSKGAVRAYQTIGAQAALALENLRLVEEALRSGRQAGVLRERQRLAHEIHDTLAQGFTSIVMNLEAVEETEPPASETARRHLEGARQAARESLAEARRLVWALRPEGLDRRSLAEALESLSERWAEETGVSVRANVTGTPRGLPPEAEVALLRVAQEALGNVRKHAGAERAALTLSYMDDLVVLDILDDGAGFDPHAPRAGVGAQDSGGFGLRSMRERVELLGGRFLIDSSPGSGTSLTVELPTAERETPEEVR
ncbi:MAG: GAF domain-containing sensor histidine kinase, partial [Actinomycetota bacterium]|nr:GAF domain-containing sensor histidine kinase [Actinomycetota bacterium]